MKITSLSVLLFLVTSALTISAFAQQSGGDTDITQAKLKKMPSMKAPPEAKKSGLGGKVNVLVNIRNDGTVSSVESVNGPDWVCPAVTRADVVAIREAANAAAMKVAFEPAMKNGEPTESSMFITFNFPQKIEPMESQAESNYSAAASAQAPAAENNGQGQSRTYTVKGNAAATATSANPPDYSGHVSTAGKNDSDTNKSDTLTVKGDRYANLALPGDEDRKTIFGGVLNGKASRLVRPSYPPAARAVRAGGAVSVQVLIDEKGDMFSAEPVSGHPLLRSAARLAACESKFAPTTLSGQPVKVSGIITYNFVP
jgi:outer membrane biosynthesis protein TonB